MKYLVAHVEELVSAEANVGVKKALSRLPIYLHAFLTQCCNFLAKYYVCNVKNVLTRYLSSTISLRSPFSCLRAYVSFVV